jgi:hypothetical protein
LAGSAASDFTSKEVLQAGDEVGSSQGASGGFGSAEVAEILLRVPLQQCFEIWNSIKDRPHRDQGIVDSGKVGSNAGPLPILRAGDEAGTDWVEADISDSADEVEIVEHDGREAALEEMAGPAPASIDEVGVAPVGFADSASKVVSERRLEDQVNVVWHQAIGLHRNSGL